MAFRYLENIIVLFLQILMSLLNLLIHGVISDETTSSLDSGQQQRNNELDFSFSCNNNRANNIYGYRCHKRVNSGTEINHRPSLHNQESSDSTVNHGNESKGKSKSTGSALVYKHQNSVISKIDACLSKTKSVPLHQSSFLEYLENKAVHLEERSTSKPLSTKHSTMKSKTSSNTTIASNVCDDPGYKNNLAVLQVSDESLQSSNCKKSNNETLKYGQNFVSTRYLIDNQMEKTLVKEHIENCENDQNYFTYNAEEIRNPKQNVQQSFSLITTSDDEKDSAFTALHSEAEEIRDIFVTQRSGLSNSITDLDKTESSDSLTAAFKMQSPFEIIAFDHTATSQNDTFGDCIKTFESNDHPFMDISIEEFPRRNQEIDSDVPTIESDKPKRVKHRWRKYGNPNENPDLIRDRIYALKRKEYRRNSTANKENQGYDSGIDEPCIVDHDSASHATGYNSVGKTGTTNNDRHHSNRFPLQNTWDTMQSQEVGHPDWRINDTSYSTTNATAEDSDLPESGNGTTHMSAIEFLMSLQYKGNKHIVAENTGNEDQLDNSDYLEDDAIIAMSRCGTGIQNRHQHMWADSQIGNAPNNDRKTTRQNNRYADGTILAWTGYTQSADDRSSQGASPVNGSSYRFDADYGLYEQDQARLMQFEGNEYRKSTEKTGSYVQDDTGQHGRHIRSRTNPVTSEGNADNSIANKRIKHRWRKYGNPNENPSLVRDRIYALRRREKDQRHNRNSD